ncbi:hypothetical protein [Salinarimonas rosea]|uniref:hypothetical protein n=1 Tax=Salinarimonas rosea TaxID=552063 RepID=UPI00069371B4|nr:hypothetical protein [Salinarimonas rosea]
MWICFNDAFISAVQDRSDLSVLVIRGRKRAHLKILFPDYDIIDTPNADYACRVFVPKSRFAKLIADRIEEIDYPNFKYSVEDDALHDLYAGFWQDHWRYQHRPD